jgi:hypothetical protein
LDGLSIGARLRITKAVTENIQIWIPFEIITYFMNKKTPPKRISDKNVHTLKEPTWIPPEYCLNGKTRHKKRVPFMVTSRQMAMKSAMLVPSIKWISICFPN